MSLNRHGGSVVPPNALDGAQDIVMNFDLIDNRVLKYLNYSVANRPASTLLGLETW